MPSPMSPRRPLTVLCLAALLAAPAAQARQGAEPVAVDARFDPAAQAATLIEMQGGPAPAALPRVALTQFVVDFATFDAVQASTSGFGGMVGRASKTLRFHLGGVGEPDFQAIADGLAEAWRQQLAAAGVAVVPAAQLAATPAYRQQVDGGARLPMREDARTVVGASGTGLYGITRAAVGTTSAGPGGAVGAVANLTPLGGLLNVGANLGTGLGAMSAIPESMGLQQALDGAALMEVHLKVHFVKLVNESKGLLGRSDAAVVSHQAYPVITQAKVALLHGPSLVSWQLTRPLQLDPAVFTVTERAPSAGQVAGEVLVGVLRAAMQSADRSSTDTLDAVAEPARYRTVLGQGGQQLGRMFVQRLTALR